MVLGDADVYWSVLKYPDLLLGSLTLKLPNCWLSSFSFCCMIRYWLLNAAIIEQNIEFRRLTLRNSITPIIQMEQLELKYKDEVKKNSSLLKMNETLMRQVDTLNTFAMEVFGMVYGEEIPEEHQFDKEELQRLMAAVKKRINTVVPCTNCSKQKQNNTSASEECERWKSLYVKETEESYRLSQMNKELADELQALEQARNDSEDAAAKLLEDYLKIYRQYHINLTDLKFAQAERQPIDEQTTRDLRDLKTSSCKKRSSSSSKKPKKVRVIPEQVKKQQDALKETLSELTQTASQQRQIVHAQLSKVLQLLKKSEETNLLARRSLMDHILSG